ncbi:MAG: YkgJ family cysteine cluster protein [Cephaloticoccus sp.]|nr:YkgJ family cysteine cluster protein [Cephaloticoccus sp.]MCF7759210.1 YkgJ family cysteine cluster protein [Cephaloticoccus sp.]
MTPIPPPTGCLACGACCHSRSPTFVRITGKDWTRLGDRVEALAHFIGHRAYMRMQDDHCAALALRRDAADQPEYFCTIYEQRPQVCRDLQRGSLQCAAERELKSGLIGR